VRHLFLWIAILGVGVGPAAWAQAAGDGASNYSSLCSMCYGPNGKGNGPAAAAEAIAEYLKRR
jgi:cytochrome c553